MTDWAANSGLVLLHHPKDAPSFFFGCWNTRTNPDLAFTNVSHNNWHLDRRTLEKFPRPQHQPLLIRLPGSVTSVPSEPCKQWNFRKANWELYCLITNQLAEGLPSPNSGYVDEAYQDFCNTIIAAAKRSIPRDRRKNYRPCWDAECEQLYQTFLRASQGKATHIAASTLLTRLHDKRRERWSEAVNTIDFTHTSRLAWNTLNKLTGRSKTSCPCPISANCIASQLIKNGVYRTKDHEPARLVAKEVSELWKIKTPAGESISHDFMSEEFSSALQLLKTRKAPGPDSISPELILHAGVALKTWLNKFLSSCMRQQRLP